MCARAAHTLCRRRFHPLRDTTDICYVDNIAAIKLGLLARMYEDNGDVDRAKAYWDMCSERLDEDAQAETGAAIPHLNVDPHGTGGLDPVSNMI